MDISIQDFKGIVSLDYTFNFENNNSYLIYGANGVGKTRFLNYLEKNKKTLSKLKIKCIDSFKSKAYTFGDSYFNYTNERVKKILKDKEILLNSMPDFKLISGILKYKDNTYQEMIDMFLSTRHEKNISTDISDYKLMTDIYEIYFLNSNITKKDITDFIKTIYAYKSVMNKYKSKISIQSRNTIISVEDPLKVIGVSIKKNDEFLIDGEAYEKEINALFLDTNVFFKKETKKNMAVVKKDFFCANIDKLPLSVDSYLTIESQLFNAVMEKNIDNLKILCKLVEEYLLLIEEQKQVFIEWNIIKDEYHSIFINSPVDFSLQKDVNGIYYVKFELKNNPNILENDIKDFIQHLSTSEQRSIYIFDLMYEINSIENPSKSVLVFDDIVDTFDEINQSSISYYINLLEKTGFKIIVLTHNFVFFKSLKLKMHKHKDLFFYNDSGTCFFKDFKENTDYIFKPWFTKESIEFNEDYLIALSCVIRELSNIDDKYKNKTLHDYIHFKENTPSLSFIDYFNTIESHLKYTNREYIDLNYSKPYLDILFETCDDICIRKKNQDNLSDSIVAKLCLSVGIRIYLEKIMVDYLDKSCLLKIKSNQTKELIHLIRNDVIFKQKPYITSKLTKYDIASSNIIHLNSFNYEVLFYYNLNYLMLLYKEIRQVKKLEDL